MYTLFNNEPLTRGAQFSYPQFDYAREGLLRAANQWVEYRSQNVIAIKSDHLLIRLLQSINILFDGDLERYRLLVEQRTSMFTGSLGLSSSLYHGKPFDGGGPFYGGDVIEVVLATDEDFSLVGARTAWKSWQPVRILAHHRSDLGIETIDGRAQTVETGHAVIAVNVPMLACQYQLFRQEQRDLNIEYKQTIAQFVMTYPLTNALYSHLDVVLLNRLSRRLMDLPTGESYRHPPFYITDLSLKVDQGCDVVLDRLTKTRMDLADILRNCPALTGGNQLKVAKLPKMPATYQVIWALTAARLNVMAFALRLRYETENRRSVADVAGVKRILSKAESGKMLENGLSNSVALYFKEYISTYITPYLGA